MADAFTSNLTQPTAPGQVSAGAPDPRLAGLSAAVGGASSVVDALGGVLARRRTKEDEQDVADFIVKGLNIVQNPTDPSLAPLTGTLNKLAAQGLQKGDSISVQANISTRMNAAAIEASLDNPGKAAQFLALSQSISGVNPSEAILADATEEADREKALREQAEVTAFNRATQSGVFMENPDGTTDQQAQINEGRRLLQADENTANLAQQVADLKNKASIAAGGVTLTAEKQADIDFLAQRENYGDVIFNAHFQSGMSGIMNRLLTSEASGDAEEITTTRQAVGEARANFDAALSQAQLTDPTLTAKGADRQREFYGSQFAVLEDIVSGTFSQVQAVTDSLKLMESELKMEVLVAAPILARLNAVFPEGVVNGVLQQILNSNIDIKIGTGVQVQEEFKGFFGGLSSAPTPGTTTTTAAPLDPKILLETTAAVAEGNLQLTQMPDTMATAVISTLTSAMKQLEADPASLTPEHLEAYTNSQAALLNFAQQTDNPEDYIAAANVTSSPAALATFEQFAAPTADKGKVQRLGAAIQDTNVKAVQAELRQLHPTREVIHSPSTVPGAKPIGLTRTEVPTFNADTGKVEVFVEVTDVLLGTPASIVAAAKEPSDETARLATAIETKLATITRLREFGTPELVGMSELELKTFFVETGGFAVSRTGRPAQAVAPQASATPVTLDPTVASIDMARLTASVKLSEGLLLTPTRTDPNSDALTIGYGHRIGGLAPSDFQFPTDRAPTPAEAEAGLDADLRGTITALNKAAPWMATLNAPRQEALIDVAFAVGVPGLLKFTKMIAAIEDGNWALAANELLDSKFAQQVGQRAVTDAQQLLTGKVQ